MRIDPTPCRTCETVMAVQLIWIDDKQGFLSVWHCESCDKDFAMCGNPGYEGQMVEMAVPSI